MPPPRFDSGGMSVGFDPTLRSRSVGGRGKGIATMSMGHMATSYPGSGNVGRTLRSRSMDRPRSELPSTVFEEEAPTGLPDAAAEEAAQFPSEGAPVSTSVPDSAPSAFAKKISATSNALITSSNPLGTTSETPATTSFASTGQPGSGIPSATSSFASALMRGRSGARLGAHPPARPGEACPTCGRPVCPTCCNGAAGATGVAGGTRPPSNSGSETVRSVLGLNQQQQAAGGRWRPSRLGRCVERGALWRGAPVNLRRLRVPSPRRQTLFRISSLVGHNNNLASSSIPVQEFGVGYTNYG